MASLTYDKKTVKKKVDQLSGLCAQATAVHKQVQEGEVQWKIL